MGAAASLVTALLTTISLAWAGDGPPVHDPLRLLSGQNFDAVEHAYADLQINFDKGIVTEYELADAYKAFYQTDDVYRPQLDGWIKRYPKSSSAYLARGIYFRKLGESRRGGDYASKVPDEAMAYMTQMHALALQDLEAALRLNPKSYLAILHLLNIAMFDGDQAATDKYLAAGNAVAPGNLMIRARYLVSLAPKWGGSYEQMYEYIESCRAQGLAADKVEMLRAIRLDDMGHSFQEQGQPDMALGNYVAALDVAKSAGTVFRRTYLKYSLQVCSMPQYKVEAFCQ